MIANWGSIEAWLNIWLWVLFQESTLVNLWFSVGACAHLPPSHVYKRIIFPSYPTCFRFDGLLTHSRSLKLLVCCFLVVVLLRLIAVARSFQLHSLPPCFHCESDVVANQRTLLPNYPEIPPPSPSVSPHFQRRHFPPLTHPIFTNKYRLFSPTIKLVE